MVKCTPGAKVLYQFGSKHAGMNKSVLANITEYIAVGILTHSHSSFLSSAPGGTGQKHIKICTRQFVTI